MDTQEKENANNSITHETNEEKAELENVAGCRYLIERKER